VAHLYIVECSTVQCSPAVEKESSRPYVQCEVSREMLLQTDRLMPPLEIGFERFQENELDSVTNPEEWNRNSNSSRSKVDTMSVWII